MNTIRHELEGRFKIEALKLDRKGREVKGSRRTLAPWFCNLILNQGLDQYGTSANWLNYCHVGTSATTPSNSQTQLGALLATTGNILSTTQVTTSSSPYYLTTTKVYRFAAGTATGNLAEVGIGWGTAATSLFSRALILDGGGSPTTITVLSDETLDVTYEFRCYVPETDVTGTIVLNGVTHDYTLRAARVTTVHSSNGWSAADDAIMDVSDYGLTTGSIGAITSTISGTSLTPPNPSSSAASYTPGSYYRDSTLTVGLTAGNHASGIGAARFKIGIGLYQIGFVPNIMKTSSQVLNLTFRHTWARRTI